MNNASIQEILDLCTPVCMNPDAADRIRAAAEAAQTHIDNLVTLIGAYTLLGGPELTDLATTFAGKVIANNED